MPVVVPPPEGGGLIDVSEEISVNRELTSFFIASAPTQIELIPVVETRTGSGAIQFVDEEARPMQTFRLIPMASTERPVPSGNAGGGQQRKYDFTLLGEWNCEMAEGDHWVDEVGQHWQVDSLVSFNGYERKGMVMSYGRRARHD
jgi:hypothetical protein